MILRPRQGESVEPVLHVGAGSAVSLSSVSKVYGAGEGAVHAVENVTLDVEFGEFLCLVGASGCGKSTLLSMLAGLDKPTTGSVEVRGGRPTLIFQEPALFPWLTVERNIDLALKLRRIERADRKQVVASLLEMVHASDFG